MTVTGPVALQADELDAPIGRVMPELKRGAAALRRLGIESPRQALFHLPFRYDDFSELRSLGDLVEDEKQSAAARVTAVKVEAGFGRRPQRVIAQLADDSGSAEAIWFGRRYVERRLKVGDEIVLSGKVAMYGWRPGPSFTSPDFTPAGHESIHTARVVPVYPSTAGLTQKRLRELLARILERALPAVEDPLAADERGSLPVLADALATVHFPEQATDVAAGLDRLAFDELLALQLTLGQARVARASLRSPRITVDAAERAALVEALPFELTGDQARAVDEVLGDLGAERPMRRLLQGDVGSGKAARSPRLRWRSRCAAAGRARSWHPPRSSPASTTQAWRHCSRGSACGPSSSRAR